MRDKLRGTINITVRNCVKYGISFVRLHFLESTSDQILVNSPKLSLADVIDTRVDSVTNILQLVTIVNLVVQLRVDASKVCCNVFRANLIINSAAKC